MRRFALVLVLAIAACGGSSGTASPDMATGDPPPPPDDFDRIDVPAASCVGGWLTTQVPRQGGLPRYGLAPDGTWHMWYHGVGVADFHVGANRHVAERAPDAAQTLRDGPTGALAVAPDGTPHFFVSRPGEGIEHWHENDDTSWVRDGDAFGYAPQLDISAAVDATGHAHVAFDVDRLYYTTDRDATWSLTTVPGGADGGTPWSILFDRQGAVYLFFTASSGNRFATNASGTWVTTPFPDNVYDVAAALDSAGRVHVLWQDGDHATHLIDDGGTWKSEAVPLGNVVLYDMRLDANDNMHVLFRTSDAALTYANNIGGSWTTSVVNPSKMVLLQARLGLDAAGRAHIAESWKSSEVLYAFATQCP